MARTPVIDRVREVLATSGRNEAEVVIGFTYRALAARVYDTQEPSPAQLSAIRRAVARLVADGAAERGERLWGWGGPDWAIDLPGAQWHERTSKYGYTHAAANPGGTVIFRTPTEQDREARAAWEQSPQGQDHFARLEALRDRSRS